MSKRKGKQCRIHKSHFLSPTSLSDGSGGVTIQQVPPGKSKLVPHSTGARYEFL